MQTLSKHLYHKDTLLWAPLIMDTALALMIYPTFVVKGYHALFDPWKASEEDKTQLPKNQTFNQLWDIFMTSYSGYFALFLNSVYLCYKYPECRQSTGIAMLFLMFIKKIKITKEYNKDNELMKNKSDSLDLLYFPTYGGYVLITLYQWYTKKYK